MMLGDSGGGRNNRETVVGKMIAGKTVAEECETAVVTTTCSLV